MIMLHRSINGGLGAVLRFSAGLPATHVAPKSLETLRTHPRGPQKAFCRSPLAPVAGRAAGPVKITVHLYSRWP